MNVIKFLNLFLKGSKKFHALILAKYETSIFCNLDFGHFRGFGPTLGLWGCVTGLCKCLPSNLQDTHGVWRQWPTSSSNGSVPCKKLDTFIYNVQYFVLTLSRNVFIVEILTTLMPINKYIWPWHCAWLCFFFIDASWRIIIVLTWL